MARAAKLDIGKDLKDKLAAAGIDWQKLLDTLKNLPWAQILTIILSLLGQKQQEMAAARGPKPKAAAGGVTCGPDECEMCRAHAELIQVLAQCIAECCGG